MIPLAARPRKSKTIQILLAPHYDEQGGLLYQTPPSVTSPQHETQTPHTIQSVDGTTQDTEYGWGAHNKHYCKGVLDYLYYYIGSYVPSSVQRKDFHHFYKFTKFEIDNKPSASNQLIN